jgi:hypothetical protein
LSVWSGPDRNPLAAALIDVLHNRGHRAFSQAMRWPFSVQSKREIATPITRAGFRVRTAELSRLRICAVNAAAFIHGFLRAMPFAGEIHGPEMDALVRDTISGLRGYVDQGELRVPSQAHIIVAVRETETCRQDLRSSK